MGRALVALLATALVFAASLLTLDLHRNLGSAAFVATFTVCGVLVLGLPVLVLFCKRQWWSPLRFALGGALGGALFAVPFANGRFSVVYLVVTLMLVGLISGIGFWFAGIWRNENLTCPKEFCLPCGIAYKYARNALRQRLQA